MLTAFSKPKMEETNVRILYIFAFSRLKSSLFAPPILAPPCLTKNVYLKIRSKVVSVIYYRLHISPTGIFPLVKHRNQIPSIKLVLTSTTKRTRYNQQYLELLVWCNSFIRRP